MSKTPLALLIAAGLAGLSSGAALAANTITFHGEVTDSTCQVLINNQDNPVVLLPTVSASELKTAGATTGQTTLTLKLSGCAAPQDNSTVKIRFNGHGVTSNGNLKNIAANGAEKVALQLLKAENGDHINLTNTPVTAAELTLEAGKTEAEHTFAVQYISEEGNAGTGAVKAAVDYIVSYL